MIRRLHQHVSSGIKRQGVGYKWKHTLTHNNLNQIRHEPPQQAQGYPFTSAAGVAMEPELLLRMGRRVEERRDANSCRDRRQRQCVWRVSQLSPDRKLHCAPGTGNEHHAVRIQILLCRHRHLRPLPLYFAVSQAAEADAHITHTYRTFWRLPKFIDKSNLRKVTC